MRLSIDNRSNEDWDAALLDGIFELVLALLAIGIIAAAVGIL
jgi:hypothetical protein